MSTPRFCSECGKPLAAGHRFCTNCGATTSIDADARTALTSDQTVPGGDQAHNAQPQPTVFAGNDGATASTIITSNANNPGVARNPLVSNSEKPQSSGTNYSTVPTSGNQFYGQTTDVDIIPPPPPPDSFISSPQQAPVPSQYAPLPQTSGVPTYAQAPKRSRGCLIISFILLLVLVLGGVGGIYAITHNHSTGSSQTGNNSSGQQSTSGSNGSTPTSVATSGSTQGTNGPATVALNLKFTYSSVDITLVSVQQANSFSDDTSTPQGGIRVVTIESNSTSNNARYSYGDITRLIMPDGSVIAPSNAKYSGGPAAGVSQNNWIDFPVNSQNIDLSKLVLRFGSSTENQINIPLVAGADLSKYQPKTVSPNASFQYAGLNWTLTSATESLSANGQQASTGMVYITVALKALNTTANNFSAYPGDYMRLQSGDSKSPPTDFTIPTSIASQSNGSGTVTFLIPQGGTSFTLLMLAQQTSPPINVASVNFQIQ